MPSAPIGQPEAGLARTIAHYVASKTYRQALGLLTAVLRARLLAPELFGLWTLFRAVLRYAGHSHLGARSGMRFLIPLHRSRGEEGQLTAVQDTAFAGGLATNLLIGLGLAAAAAWPGFSAPLRTGLLLLGAVVVVQFVRDYQMALFKGYEQFSPLVRGDYLHATLLFALTVGLILVLGLPGLLAALLLADLALIAWFLRRRPAAPRLRLDPRLWARLIGYGLPIVLVDLMVAVLSTLDRWVVATMLGAAALGQYGVATMVLAALSTLPGTAREVMEPAMMRTLEGQPPERTLERYLLAPILNTAFLLPLALGPLWLLARPAIELVLPAYSGAVEPTRVLLAGFYFLALAYPARAILVAWGEQLRAALLLPPLLAVALGLQVWAVKSGHGLPGVAAASGVTFALLFVSQLLLVAWRAPSRGPHWGSSLAGTIVPLPLAAGLLALLARAVPPLARAGWLDAGLKSLLFVAAWLAVHALARRVWPLLSPLPWRGRSA